MTLQQAITLQPLWIQYWLYVLVFAIVVLPLTLLIWRQTRITGIIIIVASVLAGLGVSYIYGQLGYVKLLGLAHIVLWTPLSYYLYTQVKRPDMPQWPRRIMLAILAVFIVSLVFDYVDAVRYVLGERTAVAGTLP